VNGSPAIAAEPLDNARRLIANAAALILDVDGTLAETEELHRAAFNEAFVERGLDWHWGRTVYKQLLQVAGGKERIRAFARTRRAPPLSDQAIAELHRIKTARFANLMAQAACPLRPGMRSLIEGARARGQQLAIATTTTRVNVDALLSATLGGRWETHFAAVVAGDDVACKKPAPDVYLEVLSRLGLAAAQCLAIEDSGNGLAAARGAGIPVLVTRSYYFRDDDFAAAHAVLEDLGELSHLIV
jgi:HAD superfamily hydrolase (TIGR01509 family)